MTTTDFLNSLIGKTFNCDFHNGNIVNKDGMVYKRCTITKIQNYDGDEFGIYYKEERGFDLDNLNVHEDYDFIHKIEDGYKVYFNDDLLFFDNEGNLIKRMDGFF